MKNLKICLLMALAPIALVACEENQPPSNPAPVDEEPVVPIDEDCGPGTGVNCR